MRHSHFFLYSCFLFILFSTACTEPEKPVSQDEAARFARTLESSIGKRSAAKLNEALDGEAIQERIAAAGEHKIDSRIITGAMKGLKSGELGLQIVQSLGIKGTYQLVKQYEKDKNQHLLFRLYANNQLNYHDLELIKKRDQVKICDVFIYLTGENLSTTLAQSTLMMSENLDNLSGKGKDGVENMKKIKQLMKEEEYVKAKAIFDGLPAIVRQTKFFKMVNIQIAGGLGNEEFLKALADYQQAYPDAPNMYLLMIDAHFVKKDYDKALQSVNQLDSLINKDPFLDYYRGLIYKMMGNKEKQREHFELLDAHMPAFSDGTLELLITYLDAKEMDKAIALVNTRSSNYKKMGKEQQETLYELYPDFKKKMGVAAD